MSVIANNNDEQREYWNEQAGPQWVEMNEGLDAQLSALGQAMLDRADIEPGQQALDIGCGCGATTLEIARRLSPTGFVTGADLSAPMLELAQERVQDAGFSQVEFVQADAQFHPFDHARYDHATSRYGVMFFADPTAAFANVRSALRPDGHLTFICWRGIDENPWITIPMMAAAQYLELPEQPPPGAPGPFSLADEARTKSILTEAGFGAIAIEPHDLTLARGGGMDETLGFVMRIGPVAKLLENEGVEMCDRVREAIHEALLPYDGPEGIALPRASWIFTAQTN
jgi:SAM-dependent methyltransferase